MCKPKEEQDIISYTKNGKPIYGIVPEKFPHVTPISFPTPFDHMAEC